VYPSRGYQTESFVLFMVNMSFYRMVMSELKENRKIYCAGKMMYRDLNDSLKADARYL
jgi:hypothetical protein